MISWTLKTAPTVEPFPLTDLTEVKLHLRVDTTADDEKIKRLIKSARRAAERKLGRALITQTWTLYLQKFPSVDYIELPWPPLQSVTHVKYTDTDGTTATFAVGNYHVSTTIAPGLIVLQHGKTWPSETLKTLDPIEIEFPCGYGTAGSSVPDEIMDAMLLMIGHWFEHRGDEEVLRIPEAAMWLLDPYVIHTFDYSQYEAA